MIFINQLSLHLAWTCEEFLGLNSDKLPTGRVATNHAVPNRHWTLGPWLRNPSLGAKNVQGGRSRGTT